MIGYLTLRQTVVVGGIPDSAHEDILDLVVGDLGAELWARDYDTIGEGEISKIMRGKAIILAF